MKKLFTLALVMLIATAGYSQVKKVSIKDSAKKAVQEFVVNGSEIYDYVANTPSVMMRDGEEIDQSTYDWQTNTAAKNWAMTFPDGKLGFSYTIATDEGYTDRGTWIGIYDPETEEWTTTHGKIENIKTGFGCAARYGENGIVVVSREAVSLNCGVYIIEDKDNLPEAGTVEPIKTWVKDDRNIHFPTVTCTGPNHDHIHILFTALNWTDEAGLTSPYFYFRSMDGGTTWEEFMTIDYLGREYASNYGSGQDAYFIENTGENELRIVVNTGRSDGVVLTSTDEGDTWTMLEKNTSLNNGQQYRLCMMTYTPDYILWGTDTPGLNKHVVYRAERDNNGILDPTSIILLCNLTPQDGNYSTYGQAYLPEYDAVLLFDREDGGGTATNHLPVYCVEITSGDKHLVADIATTTNGAHGGFRTIFKEWYPINGVVRVGFGYDSLYANYNAVCGNGAFSSDSDRGKVTVNNLCLVVKKDGDNWTCRIATVYV